MFHDPRQPSDRSTWPDVGNGLEHEYMKLPGKRKMIRIRQTVYEDPGNPFQDELDAERAACGKPAPDLDKPLPTEPGEESPTGRSFFELNISYGPFEGNADSQTGRSQSLDAPRPYEASEVSPTARSFRFDNIGEDPSYEPERNRMSQVPGNSESTAEESIQPPLHVGRRREFHRSMSVAVPSAPRPLSDEYVSPRRFWRRENSLPSMREGAEEKRHSTGPSSARDTRFYGFYEDLMEDYDKRRSKL